MRLGRLPVGFIKTGLLKIGACQEVRIGRRQRRRSGLASILLEGRQLVLSLIGPGEAVGSISE